MLKTKVLVCDIDNLTDARYFAAWMVDCLSFNLCESATIKLSTDQIIEIMNWVEGPSYALEIDDTLTKDQLFEIISKTNIGALISDGFTDELRQAFAECLFYIKKDNQIKLASGQGDQYQFVASAGELKAISLEEGGIYLNAGGEEKTGFKDFEFFDEVFKYLDD